MSNNSQLDMVREAANRPPYKQAVYVNAGQLLAEIEREYLPRPRFEDGEPVQFGDAYTDKYGRVWENGIRSVHIDCNGNFSLHSYVRGGGGMFEEFEPNERVKNTFHDVFDADDVPIRVGDTVYELGTGEAFEVEEITSADTFCVLVTEGWYFAPCSLTHKRPDSLERIEEDAVKIPCDYFGSRFGQCKECRAYDRFKDGCSVSKTLDLLRRQREVLERGSNG